MKKMTCTEWNDALAFLETAGEGSFVEHDGKTVEVVNMCGGRYLCFDRSGEFVRLVDEVWKALDFLHRYEEEIA